ncbi:MAG: hypothetical protein KGR71_12860 [Proteobacteria bacterium]|nr:hypothetical protein [Pseudomonadota bacterium]
MSDPYVDALKGLAAIFVGLAATAVSVAASFGYAYPAMITGGPYVVASAMLTTTALAESLRIIASTNCK